MKIACGMIVINEGCMVAGAIESIYDLCDVIVVIEGCDVQYPLSNNGLSIDCTAESIDRIHDPSRKIVFRQVGFCGDGRPGNGKCVQRDAYAKVLNDIGFDGWLLQLDADERYGNRGREWIKSIASCDDSIVRSAGLQQAHYWKSTDRIAVGSYFNLPHARMFRWIAGKTRYVYVDESSHNAPVTEGIETRHLRPVKAIHVENGVAIQRGPVCHHLGFCRDAWAVAAKTNYYIARGERETRPSTIACRESWFSGEHFHAMSVVDWKGDEYDDWRRSKTAID